MNKNFSRTFTISLVLGGMTIAMDASAAPLSPGARLGITQGMGLDIHYPCDVGSCFGLELDPGFTVWTSFGPGTDGGLLVGKAQKCGGQESGPSPSNTTPGELTNAWLFVNNYATFCTDPNGEQNLFDNTSCTGAGCIGKTDLKYFYAAWNGTKIPLGSSVGCAQLACTPDQKAGIFVSNYQINPVTGGAWNMHYGQVMPSGLFMGEKFQLILRGKYTAGCDVPPGGNLSLVTTTGKTTTWAPLVNVCTSTCRIGIPPANGIAAVAANCASGTYTSNPGFVGIDTFTYIPNDGTADNNPGTVTVTVAAPPMSTLPDGTLLAIEPGDSYKCISGSCLALGYSLVPPNAWSTMSAGTDGGIIIGKNQTGGGQHAGQSSNNFLPGEITAAWNLNGPGTFATIPLIVGGSYPDATANFFSDNSCEGSACLGKTQLGAWYADWFEGVSGAIYFPFGGLSTCNSTGCAGVLKWIVTPDGPPGQDGDRFELEYVRPRIFYCAPTACADFWLRLRGTIWLPGSNAPPFALAVNFTAQQNTASAWTPIVSDRNNDPLTCRLGTPPLNGAVSMATDCSSGTYQPNAGFYGTDRFTYIVNDAVYDSVPGAVTVVVNAAPIVQDVNISASSGASVTWTPRATDPDFSNIRTCRIGTPPVNGTATVTLNCVSGTYQSNPGFVGIDSFTYIANDGQADSNAGNVTIAVTEPLPSDLCLKVYPVSQFSYTGKQGTLSITFTGNIVSETNKEIKICPGTNLGYNASSTKDLVKCKVKNNTTQGSGTLHIRDHLKCTDKPGGKDKLQFKVKSGVKQ